MQSRQSQSVEVTTSADVGSCVHAGSAEACKEAFVEHAGDSIEAGIKASASAFKKEAEIKLDDGVGIGGKVELGLGEAGASIKVSAKNTHIKFEAGAWLVKLTGGAKLKLGCAEDRCYEISMTGTAGIGASASFGMGSKKSSTKSSYDAEVGIGPVKSKFKLTVTDKNSGLSKETEMPAEFSDLMQKRFNSFDPDALNKNANQWFFNFLKKQKKKDITEDTLRQFATDETEKFLKDEGDVFEYFVSHEKAVEKSAKNLFDSGDISETVKIFNEASKAFQEVGAMFHLAGNHHAARLMTMGHIVSSFPQVATTVKQSFGTVSGLLSGSIALSMGSAISVVSGLGAIATIGSAIQSLVGDSESDDSDAVLELMNRVVYALDMVLHNQAIMNQKLDALNIKADKIYEIVNQIFFNQQFNHKEIVELLTSHFARIDTRLSDTHSLLGHSYSLISDESAELRGMLQEERYAPIQELHDIVKSKLKRKLSTLEKFLEEEFDTLYNKAKIAISGSTLTMGGKPCDEENFYSLLTHFKDPRYFRGAEDFHSVFNAINLIQECLSPMLPTQQTVRLNNLIGVHIQVDTLLKITRHLINQNRNVREVLPEIEDHISSVKSEINKIKKFTDSLRDNQIVNDLFMRAIVLLVKMQCKVGGEREEFEAEKTKRIYDKFSPLLAIERFQFENELTFFEELHYPYVWKKPYNAQDLHQFFAVHGCGDPNHIPDVINRHNWDVLIHGYFQVNYYWGFWTAKMISFNWLQNYSPSFHQAIENQQGMTYPVKCWLNEKVIGGYFGFSNAATTSDYMRWIAEAKRGLNDNLGILAQTKKLGIENHNEDLFSQIRTLANIDISARLREELNRIHQENLFAYKKNLQDIPPFSLSMDGDKLYIKTSPVLTSIKPSPTFNGGKGPILLSPYWINWQAIFPEWLSAEQYGFGQFETTYKIENNHFQIEFNFKTIEDKIYTLGTFQERIEDFVCSHYVSYSDAEKIFYYWNGGIYCYSPMVKKLAYAGLSGCGDFLRRAGFMIHTFDYPQFGVYPGQRNMTELPKGFIFKKSDHYDTYVKEMNIAGIEALKKMRMQFNSDIRNTILQQLPLGLAITEFEYVLRILHHVVMITSPDAFFAKEMHDKLVTIAKKCDRKGILDFIGQYQGEEQYLVTHYQQCKMELFSLKQALQESPKMDNYLLIQTQEKLSLLDSLIECDPVKIAIDNHESFGLSSIPADPVEISFTNGAIESVVTPFWIKPLSLSRSKSHDDYANSPILFDELKESIVSDPMTGEPIFEKSFLYRKKEIAGVVLYGQPIACSSADGRQHNILKLTGKFSDLQLHSFNEVCHALPPSFSDIVSVSAVQGAKMGIMRGASNVIGGKNSWASTALFYGGCYLYNVYDVLQKKPDQDYWQAMCQAGSETLWLVGTNVVLTQASQGMQMAGSYLQQMKQTGFQLAGKVTSKLADIAGYSSYAYEGIIAWQASPTPLRTVTQFATRVVTNVVSGYMAQRATEKIGAVTGSMMRFFGRSRKPFIPDEAKRSSLNRYV